ncbi:hydrogenase-2 assembly chaperone [Caviibacterium pharyngocola]|uniref:Hydrogenase n=1 Tax=Caviibacterium pharyngocola TaxID=28159 RepID=A0A2M8RXR9_9PAST|nr:hydrogenase-2 assembly chaperone [Caviibacterium pharyngocola]PJG83680.1 hydrogenase [Caviibacterium pharyngocola]
MNRESFAPTEVLDIHCTGFDQDPSSLLQRAMEKIVPTMQDLPFYRRDIACFCPKFTLYENQWLGALLTPWTLSLVVLPGPGQQWENRTVGDKLVLRLPYKDLVFTVSHLDDIPQYLSCSLQSPLDPSLTAEQAEKLAKDCLYMMLSLPVKQKTPDLGKRNIFKALAD